MIDPYYVTDTALQVGFNFTLDSHLSNLADSNLTIKPE